MTDSTGTLDGETYPAAHFLVVVNDEDQYSVWPQGRDLPAGWSATGFCGSRQECLQHIEDVWTDLRPLTVRRRHQALGTGQSGRGSLPGRPASPTDGTA